MIAVSTRTPRDVANEIIAKAAQKYDVSAKDILGPARFKTIVAARHEAIADVTQALPWLSYPQLGRIFGNRDHTTIMHALKKRGALPYRERGCNGGGLGTTARIYGHRIDYLFDCIRWALAASAAEEGEVSHENP